MASPTRPARPARKTARPATRPASTSAGEYGEAFPNSRKVYVDGSNGVRVPMREIALSGGEPPLRVYDTSGPQGVDVRQGLPPVRGEWIRRRDAESLRGGNAPEAIQRVPRANDGIASVAEPALSAVEGLPRNDSIPETLRRQPLRGTGPITQLYYARKGQIT
jgi:phosphomethylpyrimidine synthase